MLISEVIRLDKSHHNVKSFDCGIDSVTQYLRRHASKNMALNLSNTFVLAYDIPNSNQTKNQAKSQNIAGFYTLAHATIAAHTVPVKHKLPRYPTPVILLAQFGIDQSVQGQGLGKKLLIRALRHTYQICTDEHGIPAAGLILDAVNDQALSFYQSFDFFKPLHSENNSLTRLFVSIDSLAGI